jgi:hypothetical protein
MPKGGWDRVLHQLEVRFQTVYKIAKPLVDPLDDEKKDAYKNQIRNMWSTLKGKRVVTKAERRSESQEVAKTLVPPAGYGVSLVKARDVNPRKLRAMIDGNKVEELKAKGILVPTVDAPLLHVVRRRNRSGSRSESGGGDGSDEGESNSDGDF